MGKVGLALSGGSSYNRCDGLLTLEAQQQAAEEKRIEQTYNQFATDNSDFNDMWDSGQLQAYMDENPGHNAISAYMALTHEAKLDAAEKEAEEKARKDAEQQAARNKKVKEGARSLDSGPTSTAHVVEQTPPELKDTKKFGGLATVLTQRALARRAARQ